MTNTRLRFSALFGLFAIAGLGAGMAPTTLHAQNASYGGTLRAALAILPECVDPQQDVYGYGFSLGPGRQLIDTLTYAPASGGGAIEPWLAKSWTVDDRAEIFTFTLRDDVTFSNGEKLNAQVVADNFNWLSKQNSSVAGAAAIEGFVEAKVLGDYQIAIKFGTPHADFLYRTTNGNLGIVAPETLKKSAEQRCAEGVIGSGPFVQDGPVNFNRAVTFKRREDYNWAPPSLDHKGKAYVEKIEWQVIPEGAVRTGALRSGQVDLIFQASTKDVPTLQQQGFEIHTDSVNWLNVGFFANTSKPNLSELAVRQAIQIGIDRQKVIDYAFDGIGVPARNLLASGSPLYNDLSGLLTQDQDKARQILDAAGWIVPPGGKIRQRDGRPLEIELTFRENAYNQVTTEAVQQQLAQIGIQIKLRPRTGSDFSAAVNAKDYELHRWSSEFWPPRLLSPKGNNSSQLTGEAADELDRLFEISARTADPEKARSAAKDWETVVLEKGYFFPILESPSPNTVNSAHVKGLDQRSFGTSGTIHLYAASLED